MTRSEAISYYGSQAKLAAALGIKRQAVNQWPDKIPIGRAYQLEVITNGALKVNGESRAVS